MTWGVVSIEGNEMQSSHAVMSGLSRLDAQKFKNSTVLGCMDV
jgi:hypothetical protein